MSRTSGSFSTAIRILFLILLAFLVLGEPVLFLIFFVPIIGWFLWRDQDRITQLEKRLDALQNPSGKKPDEK